MMTDQERGKAKEQLILAEMKAETQTEKDIIHLKYIELSIMPYSRWWRFGYLSSVRRARRALEREAKNEKNLLTLDEVMATRDIIWLETDAPYTKDHQTSIVEARRKSKPYDDPICFQVMNTGKLTMTSICYYGKVIRCWYKMPTDEQRKAACWNADGT